MPRSRRMTPPAKPSALALAIAMVLGLALTGCTTPNRSPSTSNPTGAGALSILSPTPYAVFQQSPARHARIRVEGTAPDAVAVVEARVTLMAPYQPGVDGKSTEFAVIARPQHTAFTGLLDVPSGGWYTLKVRGKDRRGRVVAEAEVMKIGVGEVFLAAGHSFCANSQGDAPGKARDDRVATCADWSDTPALPLRFRHCDDPLRPATANRASPWPAVGDALVARLHVPVLFVSTGAGGTTVEEWRQSAADPSLKVRGYPECRTALRQIAPYTGLRAVVWFGNENDLWSGPTAEVFRQNLAQVIAQARRDAGNPRLPWIIAFDAYFPAVAEKLGLVEKQRRKE